LLFFIAKHIPLKQYAFDDSKSPQYQKLKIDKLPRILKFEKQDYEFLLAYYKHKYNKVIKPIKFRKGKSIPEDIFCPQCGAPHHYLYDNNGGKGQFQCKICGLTFCNNDIDRKPITLTCPYCNHTLIPKKDRKHFRIHKCINKKCSYYLANLKKLPKDLSSKDKFKYKLHYIYREFTIDFFKMDLNSLPEWATGFKFNKKSAHIMGLCLTYHVNLGLSLRKASQALKEIHNINISHTMIANYARTAAVIIKPFVDSFDYRPSNTLIADETYIKVKGIRGYIWFIADALTRSILGYQVSDTRAVGPCILAMRMAFSKFKEFPGKALKFIADGYSAYALASQQFAIKEEKFFEITQVIGLTNDDAVSKEFRPYKQMIERLNRTFKASYRVTCGYGSDDGAAYGVSLWVAYYNFLRPHKLYNWYRPLNEVDLLKDAENMPGKWQLLIYLGQQTIMKLQHQQCS
jgi:transposase-like protein/ssDNA-binding Zn-finger/Zn-ribbon topoisomerase 1